MMRQAAEANPYHPRPLYTTAAVVLPLLIPKARYRTWNRNAVSETRRMTLLSSKLYSETGRVMYAWSLLNGPSTTTAAEASVLALNSRFSLLFLLTRHTVVEHDV